MDYNDPYMEWYRKITRRIISPMNERRPGQFLPAGFAFQVLVSYNDHKILQFFFSLL